MTKRKTPLEPRPLNTPEQVRAEFDRKGMSYAEWARSHKVSRHLVAQVLKGGRACRRGQSHKIAVLLGLKHGEIVQ